MALKGIEKVIQKFCVQTAVHWANPVSDGYGGFTFDTPVEIDCRWEDRKEVRLGKDGQMYDSQSQILLTTDVAVGEYLWLGTLTELETLSNGDSSIDTDNPRTVPNAGTVIQMDKIPMVFKNDEFVRKAYLFDFGKF